MFYFPDFHRIIKFPRNFTKISYYPQNLLKILVKIPENFSNVRKPSILELFAYSVLKSIL